MSAPRDTTARHRAPSSRPTGTPPASRPGGVEGRHRAPTAGTPALRRTGLAVACAGAALALIIPTTSAALPEASQTAVSVLAGAGRTAEAGGVGAVGSAPARPQSAARKTAAASAASNTAAEKAKQAARKKQAADRARAARTPQQRAGLQAPLSASTMTSPFGQRVSPITGQLDEMHTGQDFGAPAGAPVKAAGSGTVKEAGWHAYGGGNRVVIDHGNGLKTSYNHMSAIDVHVGQRIAQGQLVGAVGSTGASTGPHLHFEVFVQGKLVDPLPWLPGVAHRS
ncbi:hypothetical protein GCM10011512_15630 [Tersicoccus solisilvae]|uniref:M23ase beta-sheet core domain-containing protein n=1 Tax=Tersicoccus solisilvae TaxID=1882339 RepID=A0ABQ1P543_9MICC|nr:M23 family metallopeptidase [Tersicoccus solisilvae]GGC89549.1 hypothetical protein GCM10011512_15630 [Tersicoccus solisilvae]